MNTRQILLLAGFLLGFMVTGRAQSLAPSPFLAGDRWCVLGDSITEGGGYHHYVELFFLTRYPNTPIHVINSGIRGDTATGANHRLGWDCLEHKPTVVSVMLGMNDVGRSYYKYKESADFFKNCLERAKAYEQEMRALTRSLVGSGARVILIKPSIFDDTADLPTPNLPGCGEALAGYSNIVDKIASDHNLALVDFNAPMTAINSRQQKIEPHFTIVGPDRVHPTAPGHFVMAYEFLKTMGVQGVVSNIAIMVNDTASYKADHCKVSDLKVETEGLSFQCVEDSLPFPVESSARLSLNFVPFTRDYNQQIFQVEGLKPGAYELLIDGKIIRKFTSAQLVIGVNLAEEQATPQHQQAMQVLAALQLKWNAAAKLRSIAFIEHNVWPKVSRPLTPEKISAELEAGLTKLSTNVAWKGRLKANYLADKASEPALLKVIEDTLATARRCSITTPHRYVLRLTK